MRPSWGKAFIDHVFTQDSRRKIRPAPQASRAREEKQRTARCTGKQRHTRTGRRCTKDAFMAEESEKLPPRHRGAAPGNSCASPYPQASPRSFSNAHGSRQKPLCPSASADERSTSANRAKNPKLGCEKTHHACRDPYRRLHPRKRECLPDTKLVLREWERQQRPNVRAMHTMKDAKKTTCPFRSPTLFSVTDARGHLIPSHTHCGP